MQSQMSRRPLMGHPGRSQAPPASQGAQKYVAQAPHTPQPMSRPPPPPPPPPPPATSPLFTHARPPLSQTLRPPLSANATPMTAPRPSQPAGHANAHEASLLSAHSSRAAASSRIEVRDVAELVRQLAESRYTARQLQQRVSQYETSASLMSAGGQSTVQPPTQTQSGAAGETSGVEGGAVRKKMSSGSSSSSISSSSESSSTTSAACGLNSSAVPQRQHNNKNRRHHMLPDKKHSKKAMRSKDHSEAAITAAASRPSAVARRQRRSASLQEEQGGDLFSSSSSSCLSSRTTTTAMLSTSAADSLSDQHSEASLPRHTHRVSSSQRRGESAKERRREEKKRREGERGDRYRTSSPHSDREGRERMHAVRQGRPSSMLPARRHSSAAAHHRESFVKDTREGEALSTSVSRPSRRHHHHSSVSESRRSKTAPADRGEEKTKAAARTIIVAHAPPSTTTTTSTAAAAAEGESKDETTRAAVAGGVHSSRHSRHSRHHSHHRHRSPRMAADGTALAERRAQQQEAAELRRARRWQRRYYNLMSQYTEEAARREAELADIHELVEYMTWEQDRALRLHGHHKLVQPGMSSPRAAVTVDKHGAASGRIEDATARQGDTQRRESRGTSPQRTLSSPPPPPLLRRSQAAGLSLSPHRSAVDVAVVASQDVSSIKGGSDDGVSKDDVGGGGSRGGSDDHANTPHGSPVPDVVMGHDQPSALLHPAPEAAATSSAAAVSVYVESLQREADAWRQRCLELLHPQPSSRPRPHSVNAEASHLVADFSNMTVRDSVTAASAVASEAAAARVPPPLPPRPERRAAASALTGTQDGRGSDESRNTSTALSNWVSETERDGTRGAVGGMGGTEAASPPPLAAAAAAAAGVFPVFDRDPLSIAAPLPDSVSAVHGRTQTAAKDLHASSVLLHRTRTASITASPVAAAVAAAHPYAPPVGEDITQPRRGAARSGPSPPPLTSPIHAAEATAPPTPSPYRPPLFLGVPDYRHPEIGWYSPGTRSHLSAPSQLDSPYPLFASQTPRSPEGGTAGAVRDDEGVGGDGGGRRQTLRQDAAGWRNPLLGSHHGVRGRGREGEDGGVGAGGSSRLPQHRSTPPCDGAWGPAAGEPRTLPFPSPPPPPLLPYSQRSSASELASASPYGLDCGQPTPTRHSQAEAAVAREQLERDIRRHDQLLAAIGKLQKTASEHTSRRSL